MSELRAVPRNVRLRQVGICGKCGTPLYAAGEQNMTHECARQPCPDCRGIGYFATFACGGGKCHRVTKDNCPSCRGTGLFTPSAHSAEPAPKETP